MQSLYVRTVDRSYSTERQPISAPSPDEALAQGLYGALEIAADEVLRGETALVVEVIIEDASGIQVRRSAVSVVVAPLALSRYELGHVDKG